MERDTVARAVDGTSSLTELEIGGAHWTNDAIRALWFRLRTNGRLAHFHAAGIDRRHRGTFADLMLDTLSRYNWTLRFVSVDGFVSSRVQELLTDNATIRILVDAVEDRGYRVADVTPSPRGELGRVVRPCGGASGDPAPAAVESIDVTNRWESGGRGAAISA
jgi:phage terminase large subunit-like protein